jgi:hypothetical protein
MKQVYLIVKTQHDDERDWHTTLCCFLDEEKAEKYLQEIVDAYIIVLAKGKGKGYYWWSESSTVKDFLEKYGFGDMFSEDFSYDIERVDIKD